MDLYAVELHTIRHRGNILPHSENGFSPRLLPLAVSRPALMLSLWNQFRGARNRKRASLVT